MGMSRLPGANRVHYVVAITVLAGAATTLGGEHHYVMRDGRKVALVQSQTEMAVVFHRGSGIKAARKRIEAAGHGTLRDIKDAPRASVKILEVGSTKRVLRSKIRMDVSVEDIRPVFRYVGVDSPLVPTGQIVLKLRRGMSKDEIEALWGEFGIVVVEARPRLHDVYVIAPAEHIDEIKLAEELADDARTVWAHPNFRRAVISRQSPTSDPFLEFQWHLNNTGQLGATPDADIDAPEAWGTSDGTGVLIGMFDDSCEVRHEDLAAGYIGIGQDVTAFGFDSDFFDPSPKADKDFHGTAVMGLAVASANSVGGRGVAFGATFTASRGSHEFPGEVAIASAFDFAMTLGVDVHLNSWGLDGPNPPILEDIIETAFREGRDPDGDGPAPPLGMVIIFASGNADIQNVPGFEVSTIPHVIGVGSSDDFDKRSSFSSFDAELEFLAPGSPQIFTTDVEDALEGEEKPEEGFNIGGINFDPIFDLPTGLIEPDSTGKYTQNFSGTSASCPIAAGVAALILSANSDLTATDVRVIMEHTTDRIDADAARYDGLTGRSLKYGYGRINAANAVAEAVGAANNEGHSWPDRVQNLRVEGNNLLWEAGSDTDEYLVVSGDGFDFTPREGDCYDSEQFGCTGAEVLPLPDGATVVGVVPCTGTCDIDSAQSMIIVPPIVGSKQFVVWGRNARKRYSFGTTAQARAIQPPSVTITALPLEGTTPLLVAFNGNALSTVGIDNKSIVWDFDVADPTSTNQNSLSATHKYELQLGEVTKSFVAELSVSDVLGNIGNARVQIHVTGGTAITDGSVTEANDIRIVIGTPGSSGSNVAVGDSPFSVELRVESDTPANLESTIWDLGDGSPLAGGLSVPHTYVNDTTSDMVLPITVTITTRSATGAVRTQTTTRLVTIRPGTTTVDIGEPNLPGTTPLGEGGSAFSCGAIGLIPMFFGFSGLLMLRRRRS